MTLVAPPQVSIVIANFNYALFLSQAIDSALALGDLAETIVVDDGSTDNSHEVIARYGARIVTILQQNAGACAARNAGLAVARAPFVKFLDADDWLVEGAVEHQLRQIAPLAGLKANVFGDVLWVDTAGCRLASHGRTMDRPQTLDLPQIVSQPPLTTAPLHRRDDLLAVGGFDPRVRRGQEHDLHVRLGLSGVVFHYHPGPIYFYRQHAGMGRISASDGSAGRSVLAASLRHVAIANEAGLMKADLAQAFARRLWQQGRETLQRGAPEVAREFFAEASALCQTEPEYGSRSYRTFNNLIGPVATEWISTARARLRDLFSN